MRIPQWATSSPHDAASSALTDRPRDPMTGFANRAAVHEIELQLTLVDVAPVGIMWALS